MSAFADKETPPFDVDVHLKTPQPTSEQLGTIEEFRTAVINLPFYENHKTWADDAQLLRFLIARKFKVKDSTALIKGALEWREFRKPAEIEQSDYWPEKISKESETGKVYCAGHDKWGRSIIALDSAVQNTTSVNDQMVFLAWNLEFAIKLMKPQADKYLIFMHLGGFSFFNQAPMSAVKETINMLCNCFPERLGHAVIYQPPTVFRMFFNTIKGLLDPKTVNKMVFICGDVSTGSENDVTLKGLIGDNWKELVGVDHPEQIKGNSPGYNHELFWPTVLERLAALSLATDTVTTTKDEGNSAADDGVDLAKDCGATPAVSEVNTPGVSMKGGETSSTAVDDEVVVAAVEIEVNGVAVN